MSDPRFRDRDPDPIREDELRAQRIRDMESPKAMWGWVAGAVVLALVLLFIFTRNQINENTASNTPTPPAATTGMKPLQSPPAPSTAQTPGNNPAPTTTGQGGPAGAPSSPGK